MNLKKILSKTFPTETIWQHTCDPTTPEDFSHASTWVDENYEKSNQTSPTYFQEPAFKVPFIVSIARPKHYMTLFNTPAKSSDEMWALIFKLLQIFVKVLHHFSEDNYVVDNFEPTPPMSTFTFGFVVSQLALLERTDLQDPRIKLCIKVYARPDIHKDLDLTVKRWMRQLRHKFFELFISPSIENLWQDWEVVAVDTNLSRCWFSFGKVGHRCITEFLDSQASRQLGTDCVQVRIEKVFLVED